MELEQHYSLSDLAEMLKVTEESVRQMIVRHRIRAVKVGSVWRIPESAIAQWYAEAAGNVNTPQPKPKHA